MIRLLTKLVYFFIIFQLVYLFTSCDDERDQIPNVRVDEYLDITTDLADLPVSGAKTWKGGFKGIIIFRLEPMVFLAYERTCPYYPKDDCAVDIKDVIFAECPCCGSQFSLPFDGSVNKGPSKFPLKKYRTRIVGDRLHIYN